MGRYRLTVEYEGTRFRGWQEQPAQRTVAGVLRRAFEEVLGSPCELGGAGRTDAGVHALAQVAHLQTDARLSPLAIKRQVEVRLPADVGLLDLQPAPSRFHARHSASARSYLYQISRRRSALAKRFVWWVDRPLELERIQEAVLLLRGRFDVSEFTEKEARERGTLVDFMQAEIAEAGDLILFRFVASHFLWKMVRRLVGALVRVGSGELSRRDWETLLSGRPVPGVQLAAWTAPPSGLFLERVLYPGEPELGPLVPAIPVPSRGGVERAKAAWGRGGSGLAPRPDQASRRSRRV